MRLETVAKPSENIWTIKNICEQTVYALKSFFHKYFLKMNFWSLRTLSYYFRVLLVVSDGWLNWNRLKQSDRLALGPVESVAQQHGSSSSTSLMFSGISLTVPSGLWPFWVLYAGDNVQKWKKNRSLFMNKANLPRDLHWVFLRSYWPALSNLTMSKAVTCKGKASLLIGLDQKAFLLWSWPLLQDMASSWRENKNQCFLGKKKGIK